MTSCEHCGETSFYPQGPHTMGPCPLLKKEIDQRMHHAAVEHQARVEVIRQGREPTPPSSSPMSLFECPEHGRFFAHMRGQCGCNKAEPRIS